jgi:hypothetical protein
VLSACVLACSFGIAGAQSTTRVSVATGGVEETGPASDFTSLSPDGRYVGFASFATNLFVGDTNGTNDVFLHDRQLGTTDVISVGDARVAGGGAGPGGDGDGVNGQAAWW